MPTPFGISEVKEGGYAVGAKSNLPLGHATAYDKFLGYLDYVSLN